MSSAPAAPALRLGLAVLAAAVAVLAVSVSAEGAARRSSAYLAPASACRGADDPGASLRTQRGAIRCLVNWARHRDGRASLSSPAPIVRAATLKGRAVASCGQFSHTPCGNDVTAAIRAAGYDFGWFGENLFVGSWGHVSARDVVAAWLASPPHRANILRPGFRHLGASRVQVDGLLGDGLDAVWVATFASPR